MTFLTGFYTKPRVAPNMLSLATRGFTRLQLSRASSFALCNCRSGGILHVTLTGTTRGVFMLITWSTDALKQIRVDAEEFKTSKDKSEVSPKSNRICLARGKLWGFIGSFGFHWDGSFFYFFLHLGPGSLLQSGSDVINSKDSSAAADIEVESLRLTGRLPVLYFLFYSKFGIK